MLDAPPIGSPGKTAGRSNSGNRYVVAAAAVLITLISLAAALLPALGTERGAAVVGSMMILAGSLEALAGLFRSANRASSVAPATVTLVAGALVFIDPFGEFVPMVRLVIAWLLGRGVLLLLASVSVRGSVRLWTLIAGLTDVALGGLFATGLATYTLPIALFGVTSDVISSFAFVLAVSFIATAMLLFEIATCEPGRT